MKPSINRIGIGSAQFGMNYGINNQSGEIEKDEIYNLLNYAKSVGVDLIDTAYAYGNSEVKLGQNDLDGFKVISKLPAISKVEDVRKYLDKSLNKLKCEKLYGYLIHDFKTYQKDLGIIAELMQERNAGKIDKIGFSLYYEKDLEVLLHADVEFDLIQLPFNIFDRRFEPYFEELSDLSVEIHVRSIYLQGLFFVNPEDLKGNLIGLKKELQFTQEIISDFDESIANICWWYVFSNSKIDYVIVGVDSVKQLQDNIDKSKKDPPTNVLRELEQIEIKNKDLLIPSNWILK